MLDLGTSANVIENGTAGHDALSGGDDGARLAGRPEQVAALYVPCRRTATGLVVRHGRVFPMAWPARNRFGA